MNSGDCNSNRTSCRWQCWLVCVGMVLCAGRSLPAADFQPSAERGLWLLLNKAYVPPYFDEASFDAAWQFWPEPLRKQAAQAGRAERRRMAFRRYGLSARPAESAPEDGLPQPLQFVVQQGSWAPNCFTCHGGRVLGSPMPGAPNTEYAMETMIEEVRKAKLMRNQPLRPIDYGEMIIPLGTTNGTTNAVNFGVALGAVRDPDLNLVFRLFPPEMVHHDMDAPPWWHFAKKDRLYIDGFAVKSHRALMQFALDEANGPHKFREWEDDFRHIFAYLQSLRPPAYPFAIDAALAGQGAAPFNDHCAQCHGTYGERATYPQRIVPIEQIETDRVRLDALTPAHRRAYRNNWFSEYGKEETIVDPGGYLAPPLDGVWASAPYLHNGSVPTLWHLLNPAERPVVWRRSSDPYDRHHVGVKVQAFEDVPSSAKAGWQRREYFDTRRFGKSARGHRFPEALDSLEKRAVLEYLKTL